MNRIRVRLGIRSYDILVGRGGLEDCGPNIRKLNVGADAYVITNSRVAALYKKTVEKSLKKSGFTVRFELIPDSERSKSLSCASVILNKLSRYDVNKQIFVVALGGGVVGDLAGFVASVYKRGVPYVQLPTTLLAQVDSSVGGKVAVDLAVAKNMVGAFYQPRLVICDISAIKTLPPRQLRNGLAEVIKYGVIKDASLFKYLEFNYHRILKHDTEALQHIIEKSCRIKAGYVSKDEFDKKRIRAVLNFGHTVGHAIEAASHYSSRYNHGESVALGMMVAGRISVKTGLMKPVSAARVERLIHNVGLPDSISGVRARDIYSAHLHDKKFMLGKNRFILAERIGIVKVVDGIPDRVISSAISDYLK